VVELGFSFLGSLWQGLPENIYIIVSKYGVAEKLMKLGN